MNAPLEVALLLIAAAALVALGIWLLLRVRRNPRDREHRRRLAVNSKGRLGDATITEIDGDIIYYSYSVSGVSYTAAQDVSQLRDLIHADIPRLVGGPVSIKYFPRIPANSIIICEEWSGLRANPNSIHLPQPGNQ